MNLTTCIVITTRISELRTMLCQQFYVLRESKLLDSVLTALSAEFSYERLGEDVICLTQVYMDDNIINELECCDINE